MLNKNIDEFLELLKNVQLLEKEYGSSIIRDTLDFLEGIQNNKLKDIKKSYLIFDLFKNLKIVKIDEVRKLLLKLENIYAFDNIIDNLKILKERTGIENVCLNLENKNIQIECLINHNIINRVYPKDRVLIRMDYELDNSYIIEVMGDKPFIYDSVNLKNNKHQRTLCINDFNINYEVFPEKKDLDLINIRLERDLIFKAILEDLPENITKDFLIEDIEDNLDTTIYKVNNYYTIKSDGLNYYFRYHIVNEKLKDIKGVITQDYFNYLKSNREIGLVLKKNLVD